MKARAIWRWAMVTIIVASAVTARGLSEASSAEPAIMARVNGEAITRAEWQRMLTDSRTRLTYQQEHGGEKPKSDDLQRWALRMLINKRLALQEAARLNITVAEQDLDRAVALWKTRMKGGKKLKKYLKSRSLDETSLRDTIRTDMLMNRATAAVIQGVQVSDGQVQEYYEAHKAELTVPEEARLRIMAVKDKEAAEQILAALQTGADFERLAPERSIDPRAAQGGDMGWVALQKLPPPMQAAIATLKPGETGGPLQGRAGESVLVRLEERRPARTKALAEARPEIEKRLLSVKQREVLQAWLKEQEEKSKIEVVLQPTGSRSALSSQLSASAIDESVGEE